MGGGGASEREEGENGQSYTILQVLKGSSQAYQPGAMFQICEPQLLGLLEKPLHSLTSQNILGLFIIVC